MPLSRGGCGCRSWVPWRGVRADGQGPGGCRIARTAARSSPRRASRSVYTQHRSQRLCLSDVSAAPFISQEAQPVRGLMTMSGFYNAGCIGPLCSFRLPIAATPSVRYFGQARGARPHKSAWRWPEWDSQGRPMCSMLPHIMDALRRVLVVLVAFAFLFGAVERGVSLACPGIMHMTISPTHKGQPSKDQCPPQTHNCVLFCLSGFNALSPAVADDIAFFEMTSVLLSPDVKTLTEHSADLDPGIPKPSV
jgi:hypothetical protein